MSVGEQQVERQIRDQWARENAVRPLPRVADVVIIGGGIVGCSTAYCLARQGVSVALFEKGRIAGEQSGRNWGWVRQQYRSPVELPLMMESVRRWQEFARDSGEDTGFHQGGSLYLAENQAQLDELEAWLPTAREHELDSRLLAGRELDAVLSAAGERFTGALYTASDGRAEPSRAAPAFARAAERAGARIVSSCAVRGIERAAGGLHAVVTEHGQVNAGAVVCAAGAWSRLFCGSLGIDLPQLTVNATVARTAPAEKILDGEAWSPAVAIRRRADGGYTVAHGESFRHSLTIDTIRQVAKFWPAFRAARRSIRVAPGRDLFAPLFGPRRWSLSAPSPFEQHRMLDPEPEVDVLRQIRSALARWHPAIGAAPFVESWGGIIETSPDVLPIISAAGDREGFYVATGLSGHGFGLGPAAGRLVADMVCGRASRSELSGFRLSRFFDGSPIRPAPSI